MMCLIHTHNTLVAAYFFFVLYVKSLSQVKAFVTENVIIKLHFTRRHQNTGKVSKANVL